MRYLIVKLKDRYLEWSTVSDAPATFWMTLEQFKAYYLQEYGEREFKGLDERLNRVEAKGVSGFVHNNLAELISANRAGPNETHLTLEELYEAFGDEQSAQTF